MKSNLCRIGIHHYNYYPHNQLSDFPIRRCARCGKTDIASYDMAYGSTDWTKIRGGERLLIMKGGKDDQSINPEKNH